MAHYEGATICRNGHVLSKYNMHSQKFCNKCGAETYSTCQHCNTPIRGKYIIEGVVDMTGYYDFPYYCHNCGKPYPWTETIINNITEALSLDDSLSHETKEMIKSCIPDLIVDSVKTPVAAAKYKKSIDKVEDTVKNVLKQILVDVVSETVKKIIF